MDIFFICKDAEESSAITNLVLAIEAKKNGADVGVLFTEGALASVSGEQIWDWPWLLDDWDVRVKIAHNAQNMNIPVISARDSRETDLGCLITEAKNNGISLQACPLWTGLLGIKGKLSPEITEIDMATLLKELQETKKVIGVF